LTATIRRTNCSHFTREPDTLDADAPEAFHQYPVCC